MADTDMNAGVVNEHIKDRRDQVSRVVVVDMLKSLLAEIAVELSQTDRAARIEETLERRASLITSLRGKRAGEPEILQVARRRDADAMEAALQDVVTRIAAKRSTI